MNTWQKLEEYLKTRGGYLPEIRYFEGLDSGKDSRPYCTRYGEYQAATLEESFVLFLKEQNV